MEINNIIIRVATTLDTHYAKRITDEMEASAKARGTGIAKRTPEYVATKILEDKNYDIKLLEEQLDDNAIQIEELNELLTPKTQEEEDCFAVNE